MKASSLYKTSILIAVSIVLVTGIGQSAANKRAYVAGKFALELDGGTSGFVSSAEGGGVAADVFTVKLAPDPVERKQLTNLKYEDISVTCGTGMSKNLYQWIQDTLSFKATRKNGAIIAADFDYKEQNRREFYKALITEVGFPALDAASKDAAKMTVKFTPEYTQRITKAGGALPPPDVTKQKKWLPANFRLEIDGLDCSRVNKIEALVVKQKVVESPIGEIRDYQKEPAGLEIPNLVVTLPEAHAKSFYDWHEDFLIKGNNGQDQEKKGSLQFLTPDMKTPLFTLTFKNLGIFKLSDDKAEANSESLRRVKAEMYCEEMSFSYESSATQ